MKKHILGKPVSLLGLILVIVMLSGCTAKTGTIDERGLRPHLTVDLQLPEQMAPGEPGQVTLKVELQGEPVAAEVQFVFWPEGEPDKAMEADAMSVGGGQYQTIMELPEEGVYVVRAHVTADGLEAMPAKWLAIGQDAVQQLAALEADQAQEAPAAGGGGHHH